MPEFSPDYCPDCGDELVTKDIDGRERLWCNGCEDVEWLNPGICAGVFIQRGDEFLLEKRGVWPRKGSWSIPAGFLELEETPLEAAKRETFEEVGLEITGGPEFLKHISVENPDGSRVVLAIYKVDYSETVGEINIEEDEVENARFWSRDEIFSNEEKIEHQELLKIIKEISE